MIKNGIIPKELQNIIDDYGFETVVAALVSTDYAAVVEELDGM